MKKIPSLFQKNYETDALARNEVTPGCEWVLAGEGVATRKFDGTACMIQDEKLYKRYDRIAWEKGKSPRLQATAQFKKITSDDPNFIWDKKFFKDAPEGWIACEPEPDVRTGHWPGWIPVGNGPEDKYHREAFAGEGLSWTNGTYELIGPKIQGNPERVDKHMLVCHGVEVLKNCPRDFESLKSYLALQDIEGIVWRHPDGRMAKLKKRDFGFKR